jgi:hypothetical protein
MDETEKLAGNCSECGSPLARALVREIRHYEETRLLQVTCGGCERQFLAIAVDMPLEPLHVEDVAAAMEQLASARTLGDLFAPADLDLSDAA